MPRRGDGSQNGDEGVKVCGDGGAGRQQALDAGRLYALIKPSGREPQVQDVQLPGEPVCVLPPPSLRSRMSSYQVSSAFSPSLRGAVQRHTPHLKHTRHTSRHRAY